MAETREQRADELANSEDLDVLKSALFSAIEADLSTADLKKVEFDRRHTLLNAAERNLDNAMKGLQ